MYVRAAWLRVCMLKCEWMGAHECVENVCVHMHGVCFCVCICFIIDAVANYFFSVLWNWWWMVYVLFDEWVTWLLLLTNTRMCSIRSADRGCGGRGGLGGADRFVRPVARHCAASWWRFGHFQAACRWRLCSAPLWGTYAHTEVVMCAWVVWVYAYVST